MFFTSPVLLFCKWRPSETIYAGSLKILTGQPRLQNSFFDSVILTFTRPCCCVAISSELKHSSNLERGGRVLSLGKLMKFTQFRKLRKSQDSWGSFLRLYKQEMTAEEEERLCYGLACKLCRKLCGYSFPESLSPMLLVVQLPLNHLCSCK